MGDRGSWCNSSMNLEQLLRDTPAFASRFELVVSLGEGGMGAVFRARDNYRDRDVAIKVALHEATVGDATDSRLSKLWINEMRLAGKLRHPYIAQVFGAGMHDDGSGGGGVPPVLVFVPQPVISIIPAEITPRRAISLILRMFCI